MRNWCASVAMGALLALPVCAQQKDASTASKSNDRSEGTAAANTTASEFSIAPASRTLFAIPAAALPRPDEMSDWNNNPWNRHAWGLLTPKWEIAGLFQYVNFSPQSFNNFNNYGATGSFTYNANKWLGLTAEIGGYHFSRQIYGPPIQNPDGSVTFALQSISGSWQSYMAGPRINVRRFDHFVPFVEVLFGAAHGGAQLVGETSQTAFALAAGGGVDVVLSKNFAWRFVEADYLMTNFTGLLMNPEGRQNNLRIGTGAVLRWGYPPAPPKPNRPPVAACSATPTSVYQGTTEPVAIHVNASDPDNDPLTYSYTATGGTVDGTGPDVRWNPSGLAIGTYTINAKVDDGRGGSATCSADVAIAKRPNRPPVISCAPERSPITSGEHVGIRSTASDPDGDPITYSYSTTGGQVSGNGPVGEFDSTGLKAGGYTVTCTADDGQGGRTNATTTVEVQAPKELEARLALHSIYFPTDRPSVANPNGGLLESQQKRLDSLASDFKQYLNYKPDAHLTMTGHADKRGPKEYNLKLSQRRVDRVKSYLVEHGVPADHLETRAVGEEENLTSEQVKAMIQQSTTMTEDVRKKILKNFDAVVLANNRRVDLRLSTTGQESVLGLPFNAEDAAELISRTAPPSKKAPEKPTAKPAPKKTPKP
jgi:outer membrane protein OmpA-like peptidoglycan-associated protein/opacity protein-like surface antigen